MSKFFLAAGLYFFTLFALLDYIPDDQPQLLHELALDLAEFNQSTPELIFLSALDLHFPKTQHSFYFPPPPP